MTKDQHALHHFSPGMYVRVPQDTEQENTNFREFRIGQIQGLNTIAATALIRFDHPEIEEPVEIECTIDYLERCRILPQTKFVTLYDKKPGKVLIHCDDEWIAGQFRDYYVLFNGEKETKRFSEAELRVSSTRQNPQPEQQLQRYEFQNPTWKSLRDQVIDSYSILHNATFGIEDLVGSRIMLLAHQAEVIARVLNDSECRYILADEVGLGKTIEASVILKGLLRRDPYMKTLIIAPSSLTQQWRNEFNTKFWLDFPLVHDQQNLPINLDNSGYIVNVENLTEGSQVWKAISQISWGLIIVDEAHHLRKSPEIYAHVHQLSSQAKRMLILSATPIQRYAKEYLKLLALMSPGKYHIEEENSFVQLIKAQGKIRRKVNRLAQSLNPDDFDPEDFEEEIDGLVRELKHDHLLRQLVSRFSTQTNAPDQNLQKAREVLAYISENYRIENRIIRNRRAHLNISLPERQLDTSYSYDPREEEAIALEALHEYIDIYIGNFEKTPLLAEYCRIFMHAAASSPNALLYLLQLRADRLEYSIDIPEPEHVNPNQLTFNAPRLEADRIAQVIAIAPSLPQERSLFLDNLLWRVSKWMEQSEQEMALLASQRKAIQDAPAGRLMQVFCALDKAINANLKVIVFSSWLPTLNAILPFLIQRYGKAMIARFTSELKMDQLQDEADIFQEQKRCHILLCDELGGEGRNFQIASYIIHIDLPWSPAQLEQRIGRVDRLGREGVVLSIIPFAQNYPENDLFRIWNEAFHLFTHSMSGLEIALEGIQDALLEAIVQNPRNGLAELVENMIENADKVRKNVEDERYFEELAVNRQKRDEFEQISKDYRDGKKLRLPLLRWAELVGLEPEYDYSTEILTYSPKQFHALMMKNAKLFRFPNMEEALRRSGRKYDYVIRGTFNRTIAVQRENLVFFAPSSDPWTDAIIKNAWEADRGRCCAIQRNVPELNGTWQGFELLYSLSIDPRPLYKAGYNPTHLFNALGFLRIPLYRIAISEDGQILSKSSVAWKAITKTPYSNGKDIHLGRREESKYEKAQIQQFKHNHPLEEWEDTIKDILSVAENTLTKELVFMEDEADMAETEFADHLLGLQAASRWLLQASGNTLLEDNHAFKEYEQISEHLVQGIRSPQRQLESVCFWRLEGTHHDGQHF